MTQRINGIKTNPERWTDAEVVNGIDYALERRQAADSDLRTLMGVAAVRGLIQPEPVVDADPEQGRLFVIPNPDGDLPPAA